MYIMKNILATLLEINVENMESTETTKELEQAIEDKFLTPSRFAIEIEKIVAEENCNYIDAICHYCEVNGLEIESVTKLVSKPLKERLKYDAINLNFMKRTSKAKLPI
jgi:UDP-N-acetyl-D-mannosaminuronic acid transferase (WecB/TagA/CpsF family)